MDKGYSKMHPNKGYLLEPNSFAEWKKIELMNNFF